MLRSGLDYIALVISITIKSLFYVEKKPEIKNKSYFLKLQKGSNSYIDRQTDRPSGTQGGSSSYYIVHTYNRAVGRSEKQREREGGASSNGVGIICPPV